MRRPARRPRAKGGGLTARSKCLPWQRHSSAAAAPQGAPGGSGQPGTPTARPSHWAPGHRLGGLERAALLSKGRSPMSPPLTVQARPMESKCPPWQRPSSAPAPPQDAPGGPGQLGTPRVEARPLGAQPRPQVLELAALLSKRRSPLLLPLTIEPARAHRPGLQALSHTVTGSITYDYRLCHIRLQACACSSTVSTWT